MKITIHHHHLRSLDRVDTLIEHRIVALARQRPIDAATIHLERRAECSPRFRVRIHLTVPGPDLRAEVCDHTVGTAIARALDAIETHLAERARNRHKSSRGLRQLMAHRRSPGGVSPR